MSQKLNDKIIEVLEGILCSSFVSGFISAHNQISLFTLKRPLTEEEAKKLEETAHDSLNTFMSMYISNPKNKEILSDTFGIDLTQVEEKIKNYLQSKIQTDDSGEKDATD